MSWLGWLNFLVFGLSENECTFISQIDSLSQILSHSLTHNEIYESVRGAKCDLISISYEGSVCLLRILSSIKYLPLTVIIFLKPYTIFVS